MGRGTHARYGRWRDALRDRVVIEEMFKTANMAFSLAAMLTHGAVEALERHGSEELKATYIEKLVRGEWTGTMNLTEPEAGSDLGAVRTRRSNRPMGHIDSSAPRSSLPGVIRT